MGGASGHISHVYDDLDLTFGEIKDILTAVAEGTLEEVTEKLDGLALHFSWSSGSNRVRAARNKGDVLTGEMSHEDLAAKYAGRSTLSDAFSKGFSVLERALTVLSRKEKTEIFGPRTNVWYPIEIIYTKNPNVIFYDRNNIVLHKTPIITVDESGNFERGPQDNPGLELLLGAVERMQAAVDSSDWQLNGPKIVAMRGLANRTVLFTALRQLESLGVSDGDTLGAYAVRVLVNTEFRDLNIPSESKEALARYVAELPNPGLNHIKKTVPKWLVERVREIAANKTALMRSALEPVERIVTKFANEVLRDLKSSFVSDAGAEVARIRKSVERAIKEFGASPNEKIASQIKYQLSRLGSVENIVTPMEGVVFVVKDRSGARRAFKLTGSFSSVNSILNAGRR